MFPPGDISGRSTIQQHQAAMESGCGPFALLAAIAVPAAVRAGVLKRHAWNAASDLPRLVSSWMLQPARRGRQCSMKTPHRLHAPGLTSAMTR